MTQTGAFVTQDDLTQLAFDERRPNVLTSVGSDGTLRVFDILHPDLEPRVVRTGHAVDEVALSAPPLVLTSGSGSVSIWDSFDGALIEKFDLSGSIFDLRLADNGTYSFLQVGWVERSGTDPTPVARMRLWRGRTGAPVQTLLSNALQTSFSRDHRHLQIVYNNESGGFDVEVRTYPDLKPGVLMHPSAPGSDPAASVNLSIASDSHAKKLVTLTQHFGSPSTIRIEVWDPNMGRTGELSSAFPHGDVTGFDMTPDGKFVVISGYDRTQKTDKGYVEKLPTDGSPGKSLDRYNGSDTSITYSADGQYLVLGDDTGRALVYGPTGRKTFTRAKKDHSSAPLSAVAISRDSQLIATGSEDGTVVLWDRQSKKELRHFELGTGIATLEFDAKSDFLLADGIGISTTILATAGDEGRNAVMLVDPIPEPPYQSVAFEPSTKNGGLNVVSTDGQYVLRYPCVACVSESALLGEVERRLARSKLQG